jgi:hypothetical protein
MTKPRPCFETNKALEEAARLAEQRKCEAIDRLNAKLGPRDAFEQAMDDLLDADERALKEKGR